MSDHPLTPGEQVRRLYEDAESQTGSAIESLVASEGFGEILAMVTGNVMAITQMVNRGLDQIIHSMRLAGRHDNARLGRQLARTEDKLELVLQMVEQIDRLVRDSQSPATSVIAGSSQPNGEGTVPSSTSTGPQAEQPARGPK